MIDFCLGVGSFALWESLTKTTFDLFLTNAKYALFILYVKFKINNHMHTLIKNKDSLI